MLLLQPWQRSRGRRRSSNSRGAALLGHRVLVVVLQRRQQLEVVVVVVVTAGGAVRAQRETNSRMVVQMEQHRALQEREVVLVMRLAVAATPSSCE